MSYLSVAQIRDRVEDVASEDAYPDAVLSDLIDEFEGIASRYRGVSFEPQSTTELHTLRCERFVGLNWPEITSVTSATVTIDGSTDTLTASDIVVQSPRAQVDLGAHYTGLLTIVYVNGYTTVPAAIARACREFVRTKAIAEKAGMTRDYISQDGIRYSTQDWDKGRPTGIISVDEALNSVTDQRWMGVA